MKEMHRNENLTAIDALLVKIGFDVNEKGYAYLREGIALIIETPTLINNFTKEVYPLIAKKFSMTADTIRKAISREVKGRWNEKMIKELNDISGNALYAGNAKAPTNIELMVMIADMFYKRN